MKKNETDTNLEELAEILISYYANGYTFNRKEYQIGEILAYYAKRIAYLEDVVEDYEMKVKRLNSRFIKIHESDVENLDEYAQVLTKNGFHMYNRGLIAALETLDMGEYFKFIDSEDRDKYY